MTPFDAEMMDLVLQATDSIQRKMTKPDEDWAAMLLLQNAEKEYLAVELSFNAETKNALFTQHIPFLIHKLRAVAAATVATSYFLKLTLDDPRRAGLADGTLEPSKQPDSVECLIMQLFPSGQLCRANITRFTDRPPQLGDWVSEPLTKTSGRMYTPIMKALEEVKQYSV
jgi:hypothetical protein